MALAEIKFLGARATITLNRPAKHNVIEGTDLALACDFRVGVAGMRLRVPAAQLGVYYYVNGLRRCVERLGPSAARKIFLLGEEINDVDLLAWGYLDDLVTRERLEPTTDEIPIVCRRPPRLPCGE